MSATTWATLPNEMKLAVVDLLDNVKDIRALSKTERNMYSLAIPSLFQSINLRSWNSISHFIQNVPLSYLAHTHNLQLSTRVPPTAHHVPKTDAIIALLASSPRLKSLTLSLHGPLDKRVIPLFKSLPSLTTLSIANTADENVSPVSERFVVAIALSIPNLQSLSLDTITRSQLHASLSTDLLSHHSPYLPLVIGDSDIPNNPSTTLPLSLPSLLTIPSLKHLSIQNTHLGDPLWSSPSSASAQCNLTSLSLGCTSYESDEYNSLCVERILARVGNTLDNIYLESSLSSSFPPPPSTHAPTPLPKLRKLSLSTTSLSLSPSSSTPPPLTLTLTQPQTNQTNPPTLSTHLSSTVERLRTSPIETLSIRCWEEDVQEVCQALEGVLSLRVERGGCVGVDVDGGEDVGSFEEVDGRDSNNGSEIERFWNPRLSSGGGGGELGFYQHLRRVDVSIATPQYPDDDDDDADDDDDDDDEEEEEEKQARETAITNLLSFCSDLGLIGVVAYERKQRSNTNTNPHTNTLPPCPTDTKAEADKQLSSSSSSMLGSNANGKMLLTARFPRHGFNYGV